MAASIPLRGEVVIQNDVFVSSLEYVRSRCAPVVKVGDVSIPVSVNVTLSPGNKLIHTIEASGSAEVQQLTANKASLQFVMGSEVCAKEEVDVEVSMPQGVLEVNFSIRYEATITI